MQAVYFGGRPEEMLYLARVLAEAAADLRRLQVRAEWGAGAVGRPAEAAGHAARARVWAETQSEEVRRRARQLADEPRLHFDEPRFPPFAGGQHGRRRLQLTDAEAQLERARAIMTDPTASESARNEARKLLKTDAKDTAERRSRQARDAKPAPKGAKARREEEAQRKERKAARDKAAKEAEEAAEADFAAVDHGFGGATARAGAVIGTAAVGVWWAGKLLAPACGPAALLCAAVL